MSLKMSPSPSASVSEPPLANNGLITYPPCLALLRGGEGEGDKGG